MKKNMLILLVMFTLLTSGCQKKAEVSPLSAAMSELSGTVEMKQAGQEGFVLASADSVLEVNGQVQTGDDGRARLDLSSGTIIRVAPSSFFTLTANEETEGGLMTQIKLEIGKIFIILNGGQADVETPSGVASVRGSYMKVEVNPETLDIYITCLEGNCTATNPAGTVNFTNGQKVVLYKRDPNSGNWVAPNVEPMTPEEFQEWLDNNPEAKELYEQGMAALTQMAARTEPPTEEATEEPTELPPTAVETSVPPQGASNACSQPQEPLSGSVFGKIGQVNFAWSEQPSAEYYVLTFINADGSRARIETTTTNAQFYIEVLPKGGSYNWFVTAYNSNGDELCSSTTASFSKPQADPTEKPVEPKEEPAACTPNDYCNANSSCYDIDYCYGCIIEGVDMCQQENPSCSPTSYCDPYSPCYDETAICN